MKRFIIPCVAVLVIAVGLACSGSLTEAEQRYNDGVDAREDGRLEEAVTLYTEAVELEPSDVTLLAQAYLGRSRAYFDLGRFEESLDDSTKAIELEPSDVNVLAQAYNHRSAALGDQYEEALAADNAAIQLNPTDVDVLATTYYNRAFDLAALGRLEESLDDSTQAIDLQPSDDILAEAYFNRAVVLFDLGRIQEAEADFAKACELGLVEAC